jgi:hypothetical protein
MSYTSYREMETAIKNCEPFEGNSARGLWFGDTYAVYSYNTRIFTVEGSFAGKPGRGEFELDTRKYSVTTSRLQNIIRRAYGIK